MNKTLWSCLLSAASIAATTVWIPAQAAPSAGVRAPAQGADPGERVQRRLAEVIALLEGDDLTAEEQAKARKTLQDIVAQLRKTSASRRPAQAPVRSGPVEVRAGEGLEVKRLRAASGAERVIVEEGGETPKVRRARVVDGKRGVYQVESEAPAVGTPPKAPKPPNEGKADAKRFKASQTPAAPRAPEAPKARRAYVDYEEVERAREGAAKAPADGAKAYAEKGAQSKRGYSDLSREYAEKLRTTAARTKGEASRAAAEAEEARAHAEALRGRLGVGEHGEPAVRSRSTPARRVRAAEADDEAEIRAMIDEMRKEMREIRSLMQKIRQQANDEDDEDDAPHGTVPQPPGQSRAPVPGAPFARFGGGSGYASPSAVQPPAAVPAVPRTPSHGSGSGFARQ